MDKIKEEIVKVLKKLTKIDVELEIPPDPKLGDYAFPCFALSKTLKKSPNDIAKELQNKIQLKDLREVRAIGPYLNFFVNKQDMAVDLIKKIHKEKDNFGKNNKKENIMIEFVSPNTNKSLHLGHVRNGLLGMSLSKILEFNGNKVIKVCLNNDRGTGMSEAMLGYLMFHKGEVPKIKSDHFVAKCYVDYKKSENEETKKKVQNMTLDWENEKEDIIQLWKKMTEWVYKGYKETYEKLGIEFDKQYYESEIYKQGKEIVEKGLKDKIFKIQDGAVIAELEKYNLPNKILIKSDSTSLYMTQDIYLAHLKERDFKIDSSVYVVASEQDNHFRQLFKILELLNFKSAKKCRHLSYGLVNLPSGRMKSREGTVIDADDLIEEVIALAKDEIVKRHENIKEKELEKRAEVIGLGALKFFFLKFDNITSFIYNPEESLSFEGETGPYVQYAHARICSILSKAGKIKEPDSSFLISDQEEKLILLLSKFPEISAQAAESFKPHLVARYLIELSQSFNEFYHVCPIIHEKEEIKNARLNLILAVKQVLKNGLSLLGIDAPEAM